MSLQLQILTSLRRALPHMLPLEALLAEVRVSMPQRPSQADLNQALRELEEDSKEILVVRTKDITRVKITAAGIARHEEANS